MCTFYILQNNNIKVQNGDKGTQKYDNDTKQLKRRINDHYKTKKQKKNTKQLFV